MKAQTHLHTNTTQRIMSYPKARLTSDLQSRRRHTLGDKWSTGPIVQPAPCPFIDFLNDPLWSDLRALPATAKTSELLSAPFSRHLHQWTWHLIYQRMDGSWPTPPLVFVQSQQELGSYYECKMSPEGSGTKGIDRALRGTRKTYH